MTRLHRDKETTGTTVKISLTCGSIYITPCWQLVDGKKTTVEVFASLGKAGGCARCQLEAITRCISLGLKYSVPVEEYIDQLEGITCPSMSLEAKSCSDAIAKVLKELL